MTPTISQSHHRLRIEADLKKDGVFFGLLGCIFGVIQFVGHEHFERSNLGSELLMEHIPIKSMGLALLAIVGLRLIVHLLCKGKAPQSVDGMLAHIAGRVSALACVAAAVTFGFGGTAAVFGHVLPALVIIIIACYFAALAELAVTPRLEDLNRRGVQVALGLAMAVPAVFTHVRFARLA